MNAKIWGRWVTRLFQNRRAAHRSQPASARRRLVFEYLEDRVVPATITWTGAGGNSFWSNAGNWSLPGVPRAPLAGDIIQFNSTTTTNRNTVNDIPGLPVYDSIGFDVSGYSVSGTIAVPKLALSGGINVNANIGTTTISMDMQLLPPFLVQTFTVGSGSILTVSGHLSGSNTPLQAAQQTLTKAGQGILELTTNNSTFTGAFTLANNGGILRITHPLALGTGAAVAGASTAGFTTVNPNSQLQYSNLSDPVTARLRLNSTGATGEFSGLGALFNLAGNNTQAGTVILDANSTIGTFAGTSLNITGLITDTAGGFDLTKEGPGQLIFSRVGGNTYRGQTNVDHGTLTIRDPRSLGLADTSPQSGTVVNFNSVQLGGKAGTLQFEFVPGSLNNDPDGLLQNPELPFQPFSTLPNFNPYIGFQVFNELLTLNGPGFNNVGALNNLAGDNAWNANIIFGSPPPTPGNINIGVAANTNLTIYGVISDPNRTPQLIKILPGRLILTDANTYDGGTLVSAGVLNIRDSRALSTGAVSVTSGAALEVAVDQGIDGTYTRDAQGNLIPLRSHNRNLGADSVNLVVAGLSGPAQEVFVPGTTGSFRLNFNGQLTGNINAGSATLAADIQAALNALSTIGGVGGSVTVTKSGNVYRVVFGGSLAGVHIPMMVSRPPTAGTAAAAVVSPIYGLTVSNTLTQAGFGIANTGALLSVSGINIYAGTILLGASPANPDGSIGVAPDARPGHFTASTDYFVFDYNLTITGAIVDRSPPLLNANDGIIATSPPGFFSNLTKFGTGHLILPFQNTYSGKTDIVAGWITAQNNNSLGSKISNQSSTNWQPVTVFDGAALHLKPLAGAAAPSLGHTYELNGSLDDALGGPPLVANGGTLNATNYSFGPNQGLTLTGALANPRHYSIEMTFNLASLSSWRNLIEFKNRQADTGLYNFSTALQFYNVVTGPVGAFTPGVDATLLITRDGVTQEVVAYINGVEQFRFFDTGNLATFDGPNNPNNTIHFFIDDLIVPDEASAGVVDRIRIFDGPLSPPQSGLNLPNNLVLSGNGIDHPFDLIDGMGAVENLEGTNSLSGIIKLNGQGGIGVEQVVPAAGDPSQLTLTGYTWNNGTTVGGITKLGSQRLTIQSPGTYTGDVDIQEGVVLLQNDTGLGGNTGSVIVRSGAALEIGNSVVDQTRGLLGGLGVWGERLVLNGSGNTLFGLSALNILSNNAPVTGPVNNPIVSTDNAWRGPVTLGNDTTITVGPNSRLTLAGPIDDGINPEANGSDLTITGGGVVNLIGANTYRGSTFIDEGVLIVGNGQALGSTGTPEVQTVTLTGGTAGTSRFTLTFNGQTTASILFTGVAATDGAAIQAALNALTTIGGASTVGGAAIVTPGAPGVFAIALGGTLSGFNQSLMTAAVTTGPGTIAVVETTAGAGGTEIADGASLQLAGSFTVAGEPLLINGQGGGATPSIPNQWFQVGPAPIANGQTPGAQTTTGRINAAVADPRDPNVIYIATAGGGAWKTIDGGRTWRPIFDAIPEIQVITVNMTSGLFTLTFNGETTAAINAASSTLAADIQAALNVLPSIGGDGAFVTVTKAGNTFRVTFAGTLIGTGVTEITSNVGTVSVSTVQEGKNPNFAMFVGSILIDPNNSNIIYVGTGDANSSTDSFYGTGIYRSTDAGLTWSVLTDNTGFNPFNGKSISKMIVDPWTGTMYVASGDNLAPRNEVQHLQINFSGTFTLSFTYPDATGTIVTLTTTTLNTNSPTLQGDIQSALNALANINILPGNVNAVVTAAAGGFNITFTKTLGNTNVPQLVASPGYPQLVMSTTTEGGATNVNGTTGGAGIWRLQNGTWFNLTSVISLNRGTVATTQGVAPTEGANPLGSPSGTGTIVGTPGPDDDYRLQFPQTGASWTDIALIYTDTSNNPNFNPNPGSPVLYAALGTTPGTGDINNAVYWTQTSTTAAPIWYVGDPGGSPFSNPPVLPTGVDARSGNQFPTGTYAVPVPPNGAPPIPVNPLNGTIKIAAVTDVNLRTGTELNLSTIYAAVSAPNGALRNVFVTRTGGQSWAAVTGTLSNYLYSVGNFSNAILAVDANTVFIGGQGTGPAGAQTILMTTDGGATWVDVSVGPNGGGPHAGMHGFSRDAQGRLLVSTDGGLWRRETDGNWTNLNGNLAISQVNGVASDPTRTTLALAGSQANGTNAFTNGQTWSRVDGYGGGRVAIDPNNSQTVYAVSMLVGTNAVLRKSTNGGTTWTTVLNIGAPNAPLVLDVVNSARLLVGGARLQETQNGGGAWTNLQAPIGVTDVAVANSQGTFVTDPNFLQVVDQGSNTYDADTIYVTDGNSIFVTKNHGQTWVNRTSNLAGLGSIVDIEVDPRNRDTIYAIRSAFGGGQVYRSTNAGLSWTNISGDLPNVPGWKIVIDSRNSFLYLGTDEGAFRTNGGGTWTRFGVGLPNVQVKDMELNLTTNTLLAGTYGRSVYQLFLDAAETSDAPLNAAVVALSGSSFWTGPVILSGDAGTNNVTVGAYGAPNLPNGIPNAVLNFVGPISDLTAGANPSITKIGLGDVVFSGENVYGGETLVEEGRLIVDNAQALGDNGNGTTVSSGAVLGLRSNLNAEPVFLNGNGQSFDGHFTGALRNLSGDNAYVGPLTLNTNSTIGVDSGSVLTIGTHPLLSGTGTVNGSNDLTKELPGLLVLDSDNTGFDGATFVNQGALRLQDPGALGTGSAGAQVLDGAQIQLAGGVVVNRPLALSGTGNFGTGALRNISGDNTWAGPITLETLPGFSPNTFPAGSVVFGVDNAGETLTISGAIGQIANAATGLTKVGSGELALASANTYSGATEVTDGILDVRNAGALGLRTGTSSVQRVVTLSAEQLGNFRLSFNGQLTGTIPFNASAAQVQTALNGLTSIGGVAGSVIVVRAVVQTTTQNGPGAANTGFQYTVTFGGTLANTLVPLLASGQAGTGASASVVSTGGVDVRVANGAALELTSSGPGFTVSNHLLTVSGNGVNGTGALHNVAGNNTWGGSVNLLTDVSVGVDATTTLTLNGGVTVAGPGIDIVKVEDGTLIFPSGTPANNQVQTVASEGTVQVNGAVGNVVLDGGTISGTGTVGTIISTINGGTIEPGNTVPASAIGTLTATGGTLTPDDVLFVNLSNPGTPTSDLLSVTGTINLGGASLAGLVAPTVVVGNQFTIVQTGVNGLIGQFAGESTTPVAGGATATIAYIDNQKFVVDYFSDHVVLTRLLANVTMALAPSIASPVYGEQETFVASFTPESASLAVSGTVVFTITTPSGTFIFPIAIDSGTNTATLDPAALLGGPMVLGTYTVSATYNGLNGSGTPAFNAASAGPVSVDVTAAATTTTVQTSHPLNAMYGVSITFTATVTTVVSSPVAGIQSPRGSVSFFDGATLLGTVSLPNGTGPSAVATFSTSLLSSPLTVGTHSITAVYNSNGTPDNYLGSTSPAISQTVITSDSTVTVGSSANPSAFGQPVTLTATISGVGAGTPTGTVNFMLGSTVLAQNVPVISGVATYTTGAFQLPGGPNQTITANYSGDTNFNPGSGTLSQTVVGLGTTTGVTSSVNPSVFGQPVTFTATVTPTSPGGAAPSGQVTFRIGSTVLGTGTLNGSGVATYTTTAGQLPLGASTITAEYAGDSNYATSSGSVTQNVGVSATSTSLSASPTQGVRTRAITFTATVAALAPGGGTPTGQVTFTDTRTGFVLGTVTLNGSGVATLQISLQSPLSPAAPLGNHVIVANYLEASDLNYSASSGAATVNVIANGTRASTVNLRTSGSPSIIGNDVTFTATVRDAVAALTPGGTVMFFDATTNTILGFGTLSQVSAGVARTTFTTNALGLGNHNIQARYSGNGQFATNNTTSLNQLVKPIPTRTSSTGLTQSLATTVFGQSVTFTATVTDTGGGSITPTGTVTFRDTTTGQVLGTGTLTQLSLGVSRATLATNLLAAGSHEIVAEYNGDTDFAPGAASTAVTHVVNEASTTTALTTSAAAPKFGQQVTLKATVSAQAPGGGIATGSVTFTDNTTGQVLGTVALNANGVATLITSALLVGAHTIQATYDGSSDPNFQSSTSNSVSVTVAKSQTKATLTRASAATPPGSPSDANKPVRFTATILPVAPGGGVPTGSVTFIIHGVPRGTVTLVNGVAVLLLPSGLSIGSHNIQVQYAGDANYLAVNKTFTFNFTVPRGT